MILALMVVALALLPVVTEYTVRTANVYDIFQNFASYGLVALALGITIIVGRVRPFGLLDVPPRRDGRRAHGQQLADPRDLRRARALRSWSVSSRAA